MSPWKRIILTGYYHATRPYRALCRSRRMREGRVPIVVLTFHRVANDAASDWTVSRGDFAAQLDWLADRFDLVSLAEAQARIRSGSNRRPTVSITFDDGYAENCDYALPLLIERKVPLTYFVTTSAVLEGWPFPHDLAQGRYLPANTPAQLRELAELGVEIGAHTRTHADLGQLRDPAQLRDEVVGARADLEDALGEPVRYFAFPFGQPRHMQPAAFQLAAEAGYEAVCSAYGGYNWPGDDAFHLQRFCVDGPPIRTQNAATVDPYKARRIKRYDYGSLQFSSPRGVLAAH